MNTQEVQVLDPIVIAKVSFEQLPTSIATQFESIKKLEDSVVKSMRLAEKAHERAKSADIDVGLFNKKDAIERLQAAAKGLAEAQISNAEAQKLSFEYQAKLGEITKGLFALGVSNIVANRTVVREIQLQLKGASEEELSELARQELLSVVSQLKAQEDVMNKQIQLSKVVREQSIKLDEQISKNDEQDRVLVHQEWKDEEHDRILAEQAKMDEEHDRILAEQVKRDEEHDRILAEQARMDEEHDRKLSEQVQRDIEHDRQIGELGRKNDTQDQELAEYEKELEELDKLIAFQAKKDNEQQLDIDALKENTRSLCTNMDTHSDRLEMLETANAQLTETVQQQAEEISALIKRLDSVENALSKNLFKALTIVACVVAIATLILEIVL